MTDEPDSDEEIIAKERHAFRTRMRAGVLLGLGLGIVTAVGTIALWPYFGPVVNTPGILRVIAFNLPALFMIAAAIGIQRVLKRRNPIPKEALSERIVSRQIDEHQTRGRWIIWLMLLVALNSTSNQVRDHPLGPGVPFFRWEGAAIFVVLMTMLSLLACGWGLMRRRHFRIIDDELNRFLRGRAVQIGYLAMMLTLCAAYLAILYQPDWAASALPWVILIGAATPLICFQFLQWQAGRGD